MDSGPVAVGMSLARQRSRRERWREATSVAISQFAALRPRRRACSSSIRNTVAATRSPRWCGNGGNVDPWRPICPLFGSCFGVFGLVLCLAGPFGPVFSPRWCLPKRVGAVTRPTARGEASTRRRRSRRTPGSRPVTQLNDESSREHNSSARSSSDRYSPQSGPAGRSGPWPENSPDADCFSIPKQRVEEFRRYYGWRDELLAIARVDKARTGGPSRTALLAEIARLEAANDAPADDDGDTTVDLRLGDFRDELDALEVSVCTRARSPGGADAPRGLECRRLAAASLWRKRFARWLKLRARSLEAMANPPRLLRSTRRHCGSRSTSSHAMSVYEHDVARALLTELGSGV